MHRRSVEHVADFSPQGFRGERLVQERKAGFEDPVVKDRVLRVPRHIDHLERRPLRHQLFGQIRPAGTRHDDIGEQHVDGWVLVEQP